MFRSFVLLLLGLPAALAAQTETSRWEFAGVPSLNYDADEGFGYGAAVELYRHAPGAKPYKFTLQPNVFLTTGGRRDFTLFFDAPQLVPGWRMDAFVGSEQQIASPYYGVGNDVPYDSLLEVGNPYFYRFGRTRRQVLGNAQRRVGETPVRLLVGAGAAHVNVDAIPNDSGTTLLHQQLELAGMVAPGGWSNAVRGGIIWDTRDREVGPRRGVWSDVIVQRFDELLGSDAEYTRVTATDRRYFPLGGRVTYAQRLLLQNVWGDAPFYDLFIVESSFKRQEGLGGAKTLRGLPKNRYVGKGMALANLEARWRAADFRAAGRPLHLVVSGFVDSGRVWEEGVVLSELFSDHHVGFGGGLRVGMGDNFVVALDLAHSREAGLPFYIGLGYLF
ncbi:hypothetical protein BH23GEM5_BH23GEM5_16050 [soil metagenome]